MANERLAIQPSQQPKTSSSISSDHIRRTCTCLRLSKILILSLALVSCLISINCATYQLSQNGDQWRPMYETSSNDDTPKLSYLDYLRRAVPKSQRLLDPQLSSDERSQSPVYYGYSLSGPASEDQQIESASHEGQRWPSYPAYSRVLADYVVDDTPALKQTTPHQDESMSIRSSESQSPNLKDLLVDEAIAEFIERAKLDLTKTHPDLIYPLVVDQESSQSQVGSAPASDNNNNNTDNGDPLFGQANDEDIQQQQSNDTTSGKAAEVYAIDQPEESKNSLDLGDGNQKTSEKTTGQVESQNDKLKTTLLEEDEAEAGDKTKPSVKETILVRPTKQDMSLFQRLYNTVAGYMPTNWSLFRSASPRRVVEISKSHDDSNQQAGDTNLSVSVTTSDTGSKNGSSVEIKDVIEPNKVVSIQTKSGNKITVAATGKDVVKSDGEMAGDGGSESEGDARVNGDFPGDFGSEKKISLIRKSSLVLPYNSNDELVVQSAFAEPTKYIYAPEHHLHLTTTSGWPRSSRVGDDDDSQLYAAHRSLARNARPGDDLYGSSYGSYKSLFATHQDDAYNINGGNKSNDVYFLAMVAAFCGMAMAVVLAAGLFAYRVQQQRKSTSDTAYPTYGVVGPNNITGKCGAAGFVSGYFPGAGPNATFGINKNSKSAPDSFSPTDSGIITSVKPGGAKRASTEISSGSSSNNSTNFMVNQNAAKMYHYQHQKQQMIISDRASAGRHTSASDLDSEDENEDGSYTVYECPGLASAHEMEIKNPLFNDDQTP